MQTRRLDDIQIRDPFLLTRTDERAYYLFGSTDSDVWKPPGTGFDCYRSTDLVTWDGPMPAFRPPPGFWADRNFWAPEVFENGGRFFMFASFASGDARRGTQVLASDRPEGPYEPWSDGPVTPRDWECLDGTLFIDHDGTPWVVFCHEWTQIFDGEVVAQRLTSDLRSAVGDTHILFRGSEAPWTLPAVHPMVPTDVNAYVTDGPFLHRLASGALVMLWSSFGEHGYAMGTARSTTGLITGPWTHDPQPLWARDGGHGMLARTLNGDRILALHQPNETPFERTVFRRVVERGDTLHVIEPR